jgi:hypothetical protein
MSDVKCRPPGFTKWDKTVIDKGDLTLKQFLEQFKATTGLTCTLLLHAVRYVHTNAIAQRCCAISVVHCTATLLCACMWCFVSTFCAYSGVVAGDSDVTLCAATCRVLMYSSTDHTEASTEITAVVP